MMLDVEDFDCVGLLARHCDKKVLCTAVQQAFDFDLRPLIDCYSMKLKEVWNDEDRDIKWTDIIEKKEYDTAGCAKCGYHLGLKRVLVYYAFARYVRLNDFNDTPNGMVEKTNNYSMPTDDKKLKDLINNYRNMAKDTFEKVKEFMQINSDDYPEFFPSETTRKGYGSRLKNVQK